MPLSPPFESNPRLSPPVESSPRPCPRIHQRLTKTVRLLEFAAKSYIYTPGENGSNLYFIEEGLVKIQTVSEGGKPCILGVYREGDIFGESGILFKKRREAAIALTPVRLRSVTSRRFLEIVSAEGLVDEWTRYTTARLHEQQEAITRLVTVDSQQRLAAVLLILAAKLGIGRNGSTVIASRFTHEDLSQMVGTTRSRIGLFLKRFQQEGLVRFARDSYLVIDEPRLRSYVAIGRYDLEDSEACS